MERVVSWEVVVMAEMQDRGTKSLDVALSSLH